MEDGIRSWNLLGLPEAADDEKEGGTTITITTTIEEEAEATTGQKRAVVATLAAGPSPQAACRGDCRYEQRGRHALLLER